MKFQGTDDSDYWLESGSNKNDTFIGMGGDDLFAFKGGDDKFIGGAGQDYLLADGMIAGHATFRGGAGYDSFDFYVSGDYQMERHGHHVTISYEGGEIELHGVERVIIHEDVALG